MPTQKPHHVTAVLNVHVADHVLIGLTTLIVTKMTGNAYFKTPTPPLATVSADNAAYSKAQAAALMKTKTAIADRDAKRTVVVTDLRMLKAYVQSIANADAANAAAIITSAGLGVRKATSHTKQAITAKPGKVSGVVMVVAKSAGRASYDWQTSPDGKTWTSLPSTLQARTSLQNLTPGTTVYFRHRTVTKAGVGDWSQTTSVFVQ
jgi:hypothetical protein